MCLAGFALFSGPLKSQSLTAERVDDHLRVVAPQLRLIHGKALEQLQNGASVTYVIAVTLTPEQGGSPVQVEGRFVMSFDLWEEKYSIVEAAPVGRSGSHLTAAMAETWCLDNLPVPLPAVGPDRSFVIKLECWVADNENESGAESRPGLTLAGLIDVFSRKGRDAPPRWQAFSGPLRLADLKKRTVK